MKGTAVWSVVLVGVGLNGCLGQTESSKGEASREGSAQGGPGAQSGSGGDAPHIELDTITIPQQRRLSTDSYLLFAFESKEEAKALIEMGSGYPVAFNSKDQTSLELSASTVRVPRTGAPCGMAFDEERGFELDFDPQQVQVRQDGQWLQLEYLEPGRVEVGLKGWSKPTRDGGGEECAPIPVYVDLAFQVFEPESAELVHQHRCGTSPTYLSGLPLGSSIRLSNSDGPLLRVLNVEDSFAAEVTVRGTAGTRFILPEGRGLSSLVIEGEGQELQASTPLGQSWELTLVPPEEVTRIEAQLTLAAGRTEYQLPERESIELTLGSSLRVVPRPSAYVDGDAVCNPIHLGARAGVHYHVTADPEEVCAIDADSGELLVHGYGTCRMKLSVPEWGGERTITGELSVEFVPTE